MWSSLRVARARARIGSRSVRLVNPGLGDGGADLDVAFTIASESVVGGPVLEKDFASHTELAGRDEIVVGQMAFMFMSGRGGVAKLFENDMASRTFFAAIVTIIKDKIGCAIDGEIKNTVVTMSTEEVAFFKEHFYKYCSWAVVLSGLIVNIRPIVPGSKAVEGHKTIMRNFASTCLGQQLVSTVTAGNIIPYLQALTAYGCKAGPLTLLDKVHQKITPSMPALYALKGRFSVVGKRATVAIQVLKEIITHPTYYDYPTKDFKTIAKHMQIVASSPFTSHTILRHVDAKQCTLDPMAHSSSISSVYKNAMTYSRALLDNDYQIGTKVTQWEQAMGKDVDTLTSIIGALDRVTIATKIGEYKVADKMWGKGYEGLTFNCDPVTFCEITIGCLLARILSLDMVLHSISHAVISDRNESEAESGAVMSASKNFQMSYLADTLKIYNEYYGGNLSPLMKQFIKDSLVFLNDSSLGTT
eukprot:TRINITY_DN104_c0_g1_i9.p1 TRINITY_DN104_c0_g1~~TRINITY_DN104_c0_g1_i9.p1  ORF type:complete len:473 (+),score=15.98 TRINITY_DN104_c0_g1_i9:62-1480(+)